MIEIANIVNELRSTNSPKEKQCILEKHKDNKYLKRILEYTYNPFKKYGITEKVFENYKGTILDNTSLFELLDELANENINDELRNKVVAFVKVDNKEIEELLKCIFCKDLKAGITAKTINKVWKGLIPEFNVQLASKYEKVKVNEKELFAVTKKLDGIRCLAVKKNGAVEFYSRSGKLITGLVELEKCLEGVKLDNYVFDGELLHENENNLNSGDLYRKTVEVVNSKEKNKQNIEFHIFDCLPLEEFYNGKSKKKYLDRRVELEKIRNYSNGRPIFILPVLYFGTDQSKIPGLLKKVEADGGEGLMINRDKIYECKRTKNLLKVKSFNNADVYVKDIIEGEGKNKGKLGAITIIFEHENKKYECNVGSGFSDEERVKYWNNKELLLDKIVEIDYFEISKNKNNEVSLRFPTWKSRIRTDKTEISMN